MSAAKHTPTLRCKHGEGSDCATCAFLDDPRVDAEIVSLRNSHAALVAALERYGGHESGCMKVDGTPPRDCTCGFDAALKQARGEA